MNTGRLIAGRLAEALQAAAGWQALAAEFTALSVDRRDRRDVDHLARMAAEQAQAAFAPTGWMSTIIALAEQRARRRCSGAGGRPTTAGYHPTLGRSPRITSTHGPLRRPISLGERDPIAVKRIPVFCGLWNRAAGAMYEYQAATG